MSIAVTGAYGQLGGELCRQLGARAIPLDIDTLDLTDGRAVVERITSLQPEAVINCAAYTAVDRAETEPEKCRAINAGAVEYLTLACGKLDCPLVQISTDYVFGAEPPPSPRPWREDDPVFPQGVYARTKLEGEQVAAKYKKHWIVRTCGLYARPADARAANFVKTMLRLGASKSELRIVDDQHCTPTYVPHLARAIRFLLETHGGLSQFSRREECCHADSLDRRENGTVPLTPREGDRSMFSAEAFSAKCDSSPKNGPVPAPWGTYHVTNTGQTTWREFAAEVFRLAGMPVSIQPITTAEYGAPAARPAFSVLDTGAYHRLGGPAMPDWRAALAEYFVEWKEMQNTK